MGAGVRWPVAVAITFALVAAACSSGGGTGSNASPSVSVTPKVAKEPTSPVTISFAAPGYIINSPQIKKFAALSPAGLSQSGVPSGAASLPPAENRNGSQ